MRTRYSACYRGRMSSEETLVRSAPGDRFFDYCLEPYQPRGRSEGKLRSENLLWTALEVAGMQAHRATLEALQAGLGRDMTVFGIKWDGTKIWVELYFYDPQKEDPRASVAGVKQMLAAHLEITPEVPEWAKYMMFSFDLGPGSSRIDELNLYLTGTDAHAGRSYKVGQSGAELDNTYRFLSPKAQIDEVLPLLTSSMFVDFERTPTTLAEVLLPKLFACKKVCVAKKRQRDGIYFSGIDIDQLRWFIKRFDYPAPFEALVDRHRRDFDHLFFDVGVDYEQHGDDIVHPKTSFYGTL